MRTFLPVETGLQLNLPALEESTTDPWIRHHNDDLGKFDRAFEEVLLGLKPILDETMKNDAVAYQVIKTADLNPPLQLNEVVTLACAIVCDVRGAWLTYNEVVDLTDQMRGRPLNVKSIYNAIDSLVDRGLLKEGEAVRRQYTGRPSRSFQVTEAGRNVFALAAMYSDQLVKARSQTAA